MADLNKWFAMLAANDAVNARAGLRDAVEAEPDNFDAWCLLGLADVALRDAAGARAAFERAAQLRSSDGRPLVGLGRAALLDGRTDDALVAFEHAVRLAPQWSEPALLLGSYLQQLGRLDQAAPALMRAATGEPYNAQAMALLVTGARQRMAEGPPPLVSRVPLPMPPPAPRVALFVCSDQPARVARLQRSLAAAGDAFRVITVGATGNRAEKLNRALDAADDVDVVIVCRDDMEALSPQFIPTVLEELTHSDILGASGTTWLTGPTLAWSGIRYQYEWVARREAEGSVLASVQGLTWPVVRGAQALDGPFLALNRELACRLRFDESDVDATPLAFLDLSYRAYREGLRLAVRSDLWVLSDPPAPIDAAFKAAAARFCAKFDLTPPFAHRPWAGTQTRVRDVAQALALFGWLACWAKDSWLLAWEFPAARGAVVEGQWWHGKLWEGRKPR